MTSSLLARYIDHTLLKTTASIEQIKKLCQEANQHRFAAVCIPPSYVELAKTETEKSGIKVCTVIGFPLGYNHTEAKATEVEMAISSGAEEVDIVMNIGDLINGNTNFVLNELCFLNEICFDSNTIVKVIIESGILTDEQIITACKLCADAGVNFVKTSTGYAEKHATIEAVKLMRKSLPKNIFIKASGGIKTYEQAIAFIEAGANRIGTSSGVEILSGAK
jgi:deoxyribose-phosphate aldolase